MWTITFSKAVTGFEAGEISLSGTATATATLTGSGRDYTATITPTTQGSVIIQVPENVAEDTDSRGNTASDLYPVEVNFPPEVIAFQYTSGEGYETYTNGDQYIPIGAEGLESFVIDPDGSQYIPEVVLPYNITFRITFNEEVTGFDQADIVIGGDFDCRN